MNLGRRLIVRFFDPDAIVEFLNQHPVVWYDRELTKLGGLADQAGMTPTPVMAEFHNFVDIEGRLPTQQHFTEFCFDQWDGWPPNAYVGAVAAKIGRNFYPSAIDMYHAFGLLSKAGWYQQCFMDSTKDVVGKADLTLVGVGYETRVNLKGPPSTVAHEAERYKATHRGHGLDVVQVWMTYQRAVGAGNKRWYTLNDFAAIQPSLFVL